MGHEPETGPHPGGEANGEEHLPYRIIVRSKDKRELTIARAGSAQLAHAIFKAAIKEHPDDHVLLRRDEQIVADSSET